MNWRIRFRYQIWPRITKPFKVVGKFVADRFTIYRVAFLLTIIAIAIWYFSQVTLDELWPNIIPELLSISITIFIIDTLYSRRSDDERKQILIKQLGSKNNAVATEALKELDARGWLSDGTLEGAFLLLANLDGNSLTGADLRRVSLSSASLRNTTWFETDLEGAFLDNADLREASLSIHAVGPHYAEAYMKGVSLFGSDLRKARVRPEQLAQARSLWGALMPNGSRYDGRYNLQFDIDIYRKSGKDINNRQEMALFYGVTLEEYNKGQEWAKANLDH